jgi:hypothetical protein
MLRNGSCVETNRVSRGKVEHKSNEQIMDVWQKIQIPCATVGLGQEM